MTAKEINSELEKAIKTNRSSSIILILLDELRETLCREQRDLCDTGFMNSNWDEHMECSKVIINAPMPDLT